jgi:hypothetical protein
MSFVFLCIFCFAVYNSISFFIYLFLITVELLGLISNIVLEVIQRKLFQVVTPSTTTDGNIGPDAIHLLAIKEVCLLLVSYVLLCTNRMSIFDCVLNLNLLFTWRNKLVIYLSMHITEIVLDASSSCDLISKDSQQLEKDFILRYFLFFISMLLKNAWFKAL